MGKKARKTRWRALAITGESDSEDSSTLTGSQIPKTYHKPYFSKFSTSYSSQSTPTRRYHQHETKSTRSSSTASENKITFNEDEYTRITTPRQDVLFKKGYLNKPKNYQTQTSTGNSTTSTGNSTGNGTPDHQSADGTEGTDLEYESQFVFPNGFVDQNGIYYINSFEPYPLVVYNPPICYPEYPVSRCKRYSTDSMADSTSPHNEEASQDLSQSGGETAGNAPEYNQMYNVLYPGYYFNGICGPNAVANGQGSTEPRKIKKKRRRKVSKTAAHDGSSSSDDCESSDEAVTQVENRIPSCNGQRQESLSLLRLEENNHAQPTAEPEVDRSAAEEDLPAENSDLNDPPSQDQAPPQDEATSKNNKDHHRHHHSEATNQTIKSDCTQAVKQEEDTLTRPPVTVESVEEEEAERDASLREDATVKCSETTDIVREATCEEARAPVDAVEANSNAEPHSSKFNLNAEEFVPRAYRNVDRNLQFVNIHPNFIPIPLLSPMSDLPPPTFLPPGIPINFLPPDPKLLQNFVGFAVNHGYVDKEGGDEVGEEEEDEREEVTAREGEAATHAAGDAENATERSEDRRPAKADAGKTHHKNDIDIAKIVSKLEEAAKEQRLYENKRHNYRYSSNKFGKGQRPKYGDKTETRQYDPYRGTKLGDRYGKNRFFRKFENPSRKTDVDDAALPEVPPPPPPAGVLPEKPPNQRKEEQQHEASAPIGQRRAETTSAATTVEQEAARSPSFARQQTYKKGQFFKEQNSSPRRYVGRYQKVARTPENYFNSSQDKSCPRHERLAERSAGQQQPVPVSKAQPNETPAAKQQPKLPNQWISVSSRKKRKNKSAEEAGAQQEAIENDQDAAASNDVFEDYDVNLLQDVIPSSQPTKNPSSTANEEGDADAFNAATIEACKPKEDDPVRAAVKTDDQPPTKEDHTLTEDVKNVEGRSDVKPDAAERDEREARDGVRGSQKVEVASKKADSKKKSKKGGQKLLTKRIIIVDADLSGKAAAENKGEKAVPEEADARETGPSWQIEDDAVERVTVIRVVDESGNDKVLNVTGPVVEDASNAFASGTSNESASTPPDKKKSKKKKKPAKATLTRTPSVSSSSTTLNNLDDSYDFLLDTSVLEEKTNVEISQELDKMIQKGMYSNLEEKIKSLNASPADDDFFRSVAFGASPKRAAASDNSFIRPTQFGALIKNTAQMLTRSKPGFDERRKIDIDFSKIQLPAGIEEPQPSTSGTTAIFSERKTESDRQRQQDGSRHEEAAGSNLKSNDGRLKNKSKKNVSRNDEEAASAEPNKDEVGAEKRSCTNDDDGQKGLVSEGGDENGRGEEAKAALKLLDGRSDHIGGENCAEVAPNCETCENSREVEEERACVEARSVGEQSTGEESREYREEKQEETSTGNEEVEMVTFEVKIGEKASEEIESAINADEIEQLNADEVEQDRQRPSRIDGVSKAGSNLDEDALVANKEDEPILAKEIETMKDEDDVKERADNAAKNEEFETDPPQIVGSMDVAKNEEEIGSEEGESDEDGGADDLREKVSPNLRIEGNEERKSEEKSGAPGHKEIKAPNVGSEGEANNHNCNVETTVVEDGDKRWYDDKAAGKNTKVAEEISLKALYPITQAVKDWMTKTRENTPEVELLKSPDTIYKEFIEEEEEDEERTEKADLIRATTESKNASGNPSLATDETSTGEGVDEEIVIFETWGVSQGKAAEDALSDCWEDEVMTFNGGLANGYGKREEDVKKTRQKNGLVAERIEEGEDVLEVYESRYGGNEDYLRLKAEIEEERQRSSNFPKHGNLPYRAICCNLM